MRALVQDVLVIVRGLRRQRVYALSAILALALGVGGATTVASIADGVLLRAYQYRDPDRLVLVTARDPARGDGAVAPSIAEYLDLRERARSFEQLASFVTLSYNLPGDGTNPALPIDVNFGSASLLPMLGVEPVLGRAFAHAEEAPGTDLHAVVISHDLWQRRYGGDPEVLGRRILLDTTPYTVIGVMPSGFRFGYAFAANADAWAPLESWLARFGETMRGQPRTDRAYYNVLGRLAPGVPMARAADDVARVARELAVAHPGSNRDVALVVTSLRDSEAGAIAPYVRLVAAAVTLLLAMACATVAGLLLVRAAARRGEVATRLALGATRRDLVRQWLIEGVLLGVVGAALGAVGARQAVALIDAAVPVARPVWMVFAVDWRMAAFAAALGIGVGVVIGLVPAWTASRVAVADALRAEGRTGAAPSDRLRRGLVVGQVALACVLLASGGALLRSLLTLAATPSGLEPSRLLVAYVSPPGDKFRDEADLPAYASFYRSVLERLRALPEVDAAGALNQLPFDGERMPGSGVVVTREGDTVESQRGNPSVLMARASHDAFAVAGVRLLRGRSFRDDETLRQPRVAIVSQSLAARYWPGVDVLGQRVRVGPANEDSPWLTVVGVVADVRFHGPGRAAPLVLYRPFTQTAAGDMHFLVRTWAADPAAVADLVRRTIAAVDNDVAVSVVRPLDQLLANAQWQARLWTLVCAVFAVAAWLLATLGVYGVTATSVQQRRHEFGVRVALGARPGDIMRLVQSEVGVLLLTGIVSGVVGAWLLVPLARDVIVPSAARDGLVAGLAALAVGVAGLAAGWGPARRAGQADPTVSLRS